jgi:hypothetical protein
VRSEREWWGRFEEVDGRQTERVTLEKRETATFKAAEIDFLEISAHEGTPRIVVINAGKITQLEAEWLVLQPELVRRDPSKGWEALGGRFEHMQFFGSEELTTIQFQGCEEATVCSLASLGPEAFEVKGFSDEPLELTVFRPV